MAYNFHRSRLLSFLLLLLLAFPCFVRADTRPVVSQAMPSATRASEIRGIWIHTYGPYDWDTVMKKIAAAGFNCVFVRVARGAGAVYPSQYLPLEGWVAKAGGDEFKRALDAAHRNGLEFHAWKVCFNTNSAALTGPATKSFYEQMAAEDRLARDPAGKQTTYLNPGDPRNEELEFNMMMELATKYNVDGIHLDYIRYTEVPNYDFDYGAVSRREFEKATGKAVINWPADVYSGPRKMEYEDWERENINRLVRRVYGAVKKAKPQVQVSAAVWRRHRIYRAAIKQDWLRWVNEGWLDFVVPMDYTADHEDFRETVRAQVANTAGKMPIAAGIGVYMQKTPEDLLKQIEIARQEGTDGYVLFSYKTEGMDEMLDALAKGPHAQPAYPAYRAPRVKWLLLADVARRDDVPVAATGSRKPAMYQVGPWEYPVAFNSLSQTGQLETLSGVFLQNVRAFDSDARTTYITVPASRSRLVVRGVLKNTDTGETHLLAMRGPIIEGLPAQKIAELRAQEIPPNPIGPGRRVAVYTGGQAQVGLLKMLQDAPGLNAYPLHRLRADHWKTAQVLILPQLTDVAEVTPAVMEQLRDWVRGGGVLILTHDAAGYRWHPRLFPEIGRGMGAVKQQRMTILPNAWGLTPTTINHAYVDHIKLQPAPGATILAHEAAAGQALGDAVLIAGRVGRGAVVMCGPLLGHMTDGAVSNDERRLLLELVRIK